MFRLPCMNVCTLIRKKFQHALKHYNTVTHHYTIETAYCHWYKLYKICLQ